MPFSKHIVAQWRMCGECYRFAWAAMILETLSRFTLALLRCPAFLSTNCNINLLETVQYSLSQYWCVFVFNVQGEDPLLIFALLN